MSENSNVLLTSGKNPSKEAMKRTFNRATLNGGVTQDFSANVENIRDVSRDLGYNCLQDATLLYVPSSYGESKNFVQNPSIRNLIQQSESIDNSYWTKFSVTVTPDATTAPNGTTTADKIVPAANLALHRYHRVGAVSIGTNTYTYSTYAKAGGYNYFNFQIGGISDNTWFDLQNGVLTSVSTTKKIESVGNGWYRCSQTVTQTTDAEVYTYISNTAGFNNYVGDLTSGIYVWGAQLEQSPIPTTYQKTTDGISDFTFTRATSATVTNKQGVIEDSCYNLLQRSEEFDNAFWTKYNVVVSSNTNINPFGVNSATLLQENSSNSVHGFNASLSGQPDSQNTFSVYVKQNTRRYVQLYIANGVSVFSSIMFDTQTGTISDTKTVGGYTFISSSIEQINDYYRVSMTVSAIGQYREFGSFLSNVSTIPLSGSILNTYTGDGTSGVYIWGAQFEKGSLRDYLKTTNRLNVPRLDYSRSLLEPSLLIEPQSTNLITWSGDFSNAAWTKNNSTVTANSITTPNGTSTAYKVVPSTLNTDSHWLRQIYSTGGVFTFSIYAKNAGYNYVYITPTLGTLGGGLVDLTTGAVSNVDAGTTISAVNVGSGWWKISATRSIASGGNFAGVYVFNNSSLSPYAGDGTSGVYIWTSQVEAGSNVTTYIPTTTATVTRNGETSFVDLWNNNMLNQNNFTLFWEGYLYDGQTTNMSFCLSDTSTAATNTNQIGWYNLNTPFFNIANTRTNGTSNATNGTLNKFCIRYNNGTVDFYRNGVNIWASQSVPVVDYRYLILNNGGSTYATDKILLFNRTLTNLECIDITD